MKVLLRGFEGSRTAEERAEFLTAFRPVLEGYGLPVVSISSEQPTNGAIIFELPDGFEVRELTRVLASFAEDLARDTGKPVRLPFSIPSLKFAAQAAG